MTNSNGGTAGAKVPDLAPSTLVYIEKVRQATRRLKAREPTLGGSGPDTVRVSLDALREVATFDVEVPTASQHREWEYVKIAIKRLTAWYFRFLAAQLNVFGAHVINLGDTLASRTDGLESAADELAVRLGAAEERLRRLEALSDARNSRVKASVPESGSPESGRPESGRPESGRPRTPEHHEPKGKHEPERAITPSPPSAAPRRGPGKDAATKDD
jgi:hypothetical protein